MHTTGLKAMGALAFDMLRDTAMRWRIALRCLDAAGIIEEAGDSLLYRVSNGKRKRLAVQPLNSRTIGRLVKQWFKEAGDSEHREANSDLARFVGQRTGVTWLALSFRRLGIRIRRLFVVIREESSYSAGFMMPRAERSRTSTTTMTTEPVNPMPMIGIGPKHLRRAALVDHWHSGKDDDHL